MQKTIAGVVGAVGALSLAHSASAAVEHSIAHPASYKELLQPIPNARELLRKIDAAEAARPAPEVLDVQYWRHHHHHHHHHGYYGRWYHHHHHHWYGRPYYPAYPAPPVYGYSYPLPYYRGW